MKINKDQIEALVSQLVQQKMSELSTVRGAVVKEVQLPDAMAMGETTTLFQALDAFVAYLEKTGERVNGKLKQKTYTYTREVKRLKDQFGDFKTLPLWKLDRSRWEELVLIWRNRPTNLDGSRTTKGGAENQIKRLYAFAKWLNSSNYKWKKPVGFEEVCRTVIDLPEDDNGEAFQTITKPTYTPEELGQILSVCSPFHRAIIATCVNCAFGQSEIGQWTTRRVRLHMRHPHEEKIDFQSDETHSWVVGPRPKTKLYGEHLLWDEVAIALKPHLTNEFIWMTKTGKMIYKRHSTRPASEIDRCWANILKRATKAYPELPRLPFGSRPHGRPQTS